MGDAGDAVRCPGGDHLVFVWPSGKIVPHYGARGEKCEWSYAMYPEEGEVKITSKRLSEDISASEESLRSAAKNKDDASVNYGIVLLGQYVLYGLLRIAEAIERER